MVYKYIDIVGTSPESIAKAMEDAVDEACENCEEYPMGRIGQGNSKDRKSKGRGISGGSENWL